MILTLLRRAIAYLEGNAWKPTLVAPESAASTPTDAPSDAEDGDSTGTDTGSASGSESGSSEETDK